MKLALPTNKQLIIFVKYSFILGLLAAILSWIALKQDPLVAKSEEYLLNNQEINRLVGKVSNSTLLKVTYVDEAIDYNNNFTSGYNLYRYKIKGEVGTISATVRADKSNNTEHKFSIKSVTEL